MNFSAIELKDKFDVVWAMNQHVSDSFAEFIMRVTDYVTQVIQTEQLLEQSRPILNNKDYNDLHNNRDVRRTQLHDALIRAGKALNDGYVRSKGIALFDTDSEKFGKFGERERWAEIANHLFLRLECGKIVIGEQPVTANILTDAPGGMKVDKEYLLELQRLLRVGYPRLTDKDGNHPADALRLYVKK